MPAGRVTKKPKSGAEMAEPQEMVVHLRVDDHILPISVRANITVGNLKRKMAMNYGVNAASIVLAANGKPPLKDSLTLKEAQFFEFSTAYATIGLHGGMDGSAKSSVSG